jgi:hypothetical protein
MIAVLRKFLDTRRLRISVRSRVNLVSISGLIERTDGVVESVVGDEAYVEWANGAHSVESTRHLVQIKG